MKFLTHPVTGKVVKFYNRHDMKKGHPHRRYRHHTTGSGFPSASLPIDWTKNNKLEFSMDGNDLKGNCMAVAGVHGDNTFTGNVGAESVFDVTRLIAWYEKLSGGDNGLNEGQLIAGWKSGIGGVPEATILDALDIDPTNPDMCNSVIANFMGFVYMLAVPDDWFSNFTTDYVWDAPATPNEDSGHGTWINGARVNGDMKVQTWGDHCWVTPAGIKESDPTAFAVFSRRMFDSNGIAFDGKTYAEKAALWNSCGGSVPTDW